MTKRGVWALCVCALWLSGVVACGGDTSQGGQTPGSAQDMASGVDQGVEPDATRDEDQATGQDMSLDDMTAVEPDASEAADAAVDAQEEEDAAAGLDADMTAAEEDMSVADMSVSEDMIVVDMSQPVDMGLDLSARVRGDCVVSSDCGVAGLFCVASAVGGTCQGDCNACDSIPGSKTYECVTGSCVPECSGDNECPPGRRCNTRRGLCEVLRCTNDVCPVPWFGCASPDGLCVRVACGGGEVCPAQTQCNGSYCIEDHIRP